MQTTPNMGLIAWNLTSDPYSHSQLAANFNAIDIHDHTVAHGKQIPSGGLADGSVITIKLADGSVTTAKLLDGSVTKQKLDPNATGERVGDLKAIWTPNPGAYVAPTTWVIAMGQSLTAGQHNFPGGGTVVLPDYRNCFILGADVAGTGIIPGTPPAIGAAVGGHVANLGHTHTVNAHSHTVASHSHTVNAHSHNVSAHSHTISSDGGHVHGWIGNVLQQRTTGISTGQGTRQTLFVPGLNAGGTEDLQVAAPMDTQGAHTHTGATGVAGTTTDSQSPGTTSTSPGTDTQSPGTSSALSTTFDIRPGARGALIIIKVLT